MVEVPPVVGVPDESVLATGLLVVGETGVVVSSRGVVETVAGAQAARRRTRTAVDNRMVRGYG